MEELAKLHPVAQVVIIIAIAVVLCLFIYNYFKLLRGKYFLLTAKELKL